MPYGWHGWWMGWMWAFWVVLIAFVLWLAVPAATPSPGGDGIRCRTWDRCDHGFSTWLAASLPHYIDVAVGYTRSSGYDLNTVSFGVGLNVGAALRHHPAH